MLSWETTPADFQYKKADGVLKTMGDYGRYKNLIDHKHDNWTSEQMDNFRKFHYVNQHLRKHNQFQGIPIPSHDKTLKNVQVEEELVGPTNTDEMTEYDDTTCVKNIAHYNQLLAELKKNQFNNTAENNIKAKERGKIANLLRSGLLDWPEEGN